MVVGLSPLQVRLLPLPGVPPDAGLQAAAAAVFLTMGYICTLPQQMQEQLGSMAGPSGGWGLKIDAHSFARRKSSFLFFLPRSHIAQAGL